MFEFEQLGKIETEISNILIGQLWAHVDLFDGNSSDPKISCSCPIKKQTTCTSCVFTDWHRVCAEKENKLLLTPETFIFLYLDNLLHFLYIRKILKRGKETWIGIYNRLHPASKTNVCVYNSDGYKHICTEITHMYIIIEVGTKCLRGCLTTLKQAKIGMVNYWLIRRGAPGGS
jgi:hypothetical protein